MTDIPLHRQFAGQARLVRLLLWRIGDTTDIEACLDAAKSAHMITDDDVAFIRECLAREEEQRDHAGMNDTADISVDEETILRLRRCVNKLNRADSA